MQKTLLGIWQKVFENTEINITDDFYDLGGDSIVLMKLLDEIALAGLENISIEDILEYETIERYQLIWKKTNKRSYYMIGIIGAVVMLANGRPRL